MIGNLRGRLERNDRGVAMITAITILAVLSGLGATVAAVALNNVKNSNRDRQAGSALSAADAGVAQAIEYIRSNSVNALTCVEATYATTCGSNPTGYSNPTSPQAVALDTASAGCTAANNCAKVWIGILQAYNPPVYKTGKYRVHSEGIYGNGPGARNVVVDLTVTPLSYPIGVFGTALSGNGGTAIYTSSLFTKDCVQPRWDGSGNGTRFSGVDPYWGIPAAAHSTSHISTANNCGAGGYIHATSPASAHCPNVAALNFDQSGDGGPVAAGSCYHSAVMPDGSFYPPNDTTLFTAADLQAYGYRPRGLSDAEYASLKARAQSLGTYNISTGSIMTKLNAALAAGINQPVVYWDNGNVSLSDNDFPAAFGRAPGGTCNNQSVTIVVEHGNATFQGGNSSWFDGVAFVPDGNWNGNGGYNWLGTLFANDLTLGGNQKFQLDDCMVDNMPGPVMQVTATAFREDDSKDAS
ncbi:MAG: pilus assembly PilX N-terminal domain-containing protein [Actinomycetota bacterium]